VTDYQWGTSIGNVTHVDVADHNSFRSMANNIVMPILEAEGNNVFSRDIHNVLIK